MAMTIKKHLAFDNVLQLNSFTYSDFSVMEIHSHWDKVLENIPGYNRDLQGSLEDDGFKTDNRKKMDAKTSILLYVFLNYVVCQCMFILLNVILILSGNCTL